MKLKPYPSYKDSGVEWLGKVPDNWSGWKISHAFGLIGSGTTPPSNEQVWYENGDIPWITTGELRENVIYETTKYVTAVAFDKFSALRLHPSGSLAVAMYGATIGRLGILGVDATTNQACCVLSYPKHLDLKFTFYWLLCFKQPIIDIYATGGGQPNINQETIANLRVPAPLLNDQASIANFLDRETAKLDTLIAKQEKLIERINERIIATVMTAMTSVETQYVRFVYACDVISRPVNQALNDSFVRLGVLNRGRGLFKREETDSEDMGDSDFFWVKKGDLILSGQFAWEGSVAMAEDEHDGCVVSHRFPIINGKLGVASTEYLLALLMSPHGDFLLNENSRGSAGRNRPLNLNLLLKEKIPIASVTVQNEVTKLMTLRRKLIEKVQRSIELAEEHRTALISAVVTGKIDVREAA